mmetsp:Transcript_14303/g.21414  ORF Transcript_14303/g.21414 Transcript_14303/m.21414 type:complete len:318 (+) Transcript_14303:111-1064(+)
MCRYALSLLCLGVLSFPSVNCLNKMDMDNAIVSEGEYFLPNDRKSDFGVLRDMRDNTTAMAKFESYLQSRPRDWRTDSEAYDLIENFMWGQENGLVMEIGGLDGEFLSQSLPLVKSLGWHRILVEGSPSYKRDLQAKAKDSFAWSAAVCNHAQFVHYVDRGHKGINGILEFMDPRFMQSFHRKFLYLNRTEWAKSSSVTVMPCFPLRMMFKRMRLTHVHYFSLDVEGGELSVLHSVDFDAVSFDVISVEIEKAFRPASHEADITEFLASKNYEKVWCQGRNAWFKRKGFNIIPRNPAWSGSTEEELRSCPGTPIKLK